LHWNIEDVQLIRQLLQLLLLH